MSALTRFSQRMPGVAALRRRWPATPQFRGVWGPSPQLLLRLGALLALCVLMGGAYLFWLRDSGLVAVDRVTVSGLTSDDAAEIRSALERAGRGMTSLHVDHDALERAVRRFPEVRALDARGDFPSGLVITVRERRAAALLVAGDSRVAVAADGTVLSGLEDSDALPEVRGEGALPQKRLGSGRQLDLVAVLGGAPPELRPELEGGELEGQRGIVVQVKEGPELVFGTSAAPGAKWAAAARVLADEDSAGAEYIDLTIPERPAAGGLAVETVAPVAPAGEEIVPESDDGVVPVGPQP